MKPSAIPVEFLTHLIFAFAFVSDGDFRITNMPDVPAKAFGEVTDMKQKNPNMKVLIALGGWTFNDPGPNQMTFSNAASTAANRKKFINNLMGFMSQYGFDGADIDWEYPGAEDRGGREDDGVNFTKLLQEMKAAFGKRYLLTFTAPTSYWYLRHFDIQKTSEAVDWINLMSYDLHGIWDRDNPIGAQILGHTNLTEVDMALDLLWRNSVEPDKVVLGIGFYGRSFKLEDSKCNKPGCPFAGPGDKGPCSGEGGFLTYKGNPNEPYA
jgi:chitinase